MKTKRVVTILLPAVSGTSRDLVRGIADYASEMGDWHLVLHLWGSVGREDFESIQRGDGVLCETPVPTSVIRAPRWDIPMVGMQDPALLDQGPVVCNDNRVLGRMAGEYLVEKGLTHLAYVSYRDGNVTEEGFRQSAEAAGLPIHVYYLHGEQPELDEGARRRLLDWFEALPAPTGVLFREDYLAYKLMDWLPAEWMPERLALLGIGNDPLVCELARPTLSSVDREARAIGRRAAELLQRMMDGETVPRELHLMPPGHVVERQTTGLDFTPDPLVTRAVRLMEETLEDSMSALEVCRRVGASRRTLERRFSEALGRTIWQQQRHLQIRRARDLLRHGDKPLGYISDVCGFSNPQQFSKAFRQAVGVTPREYRNGA
jgi:LacI family transcriptional regulator